LFVSEEILVIVVEVIYVVLLYLIAKNSDKKDVKKEKI